MHETEITETETVQTEELRSVTGQAWETLRSIYPDLEAPEAPSLELRALASAREDDIRDLCAGLLTGGADVRSVSRRQVQVSWKHHELGTYYLTANNWERHSYHLRAPLLTVAELILQSSTRAGALRGLRQAAESQPDNDPGNAALRLEERLHESLQAAPNAEVLLAAAEPDLKLVLTHVPADDDRDAEQFELLVQTGSELLTWYGDAGAGSYFDLSGPDQTLQLQRRWELRGEIAALRQHVASIDARIRELDARIKELPL